MRVQKLLGVSFMALMLCAAPAFAADIVNGFNSSSDSIPMGAGGNQYMKLDPNGTVSFNKASDLSSITARINAETGESIFSSVNANNFFATNTIRAAGYMGVGTNNAITTTNPLARLHISGSEIFNHLPTLLIEQPSTDRGTPRIGLVDTILGAVNEAPAWFIDNWSDRFRVFRQPNITTGGQEMMTITNDGRVGIGTHAPIGNLDINNGSNTATLCLNGQCVSSLSAGAAVSSPGRSGPQGPAGAPGAQGPAGPQGPAGASAPRGVPVYYGIVQDCNAGVLTLNPKHLNCDTEFVGYLVSVNAQPSTTVPVFNKPKLVLTEIKSTSSIYNNSPCGQGVNLCSTVVSDKVHDICMLGSTQVGSRTEGANNNCNLNGTPGGQWSLEAQSLYGRANCEMKCFDFQ